MGTGHLTNCREREDGIQSESECVCEGNGRIPETVGLFNLRDKGRTRYSFSKLKPAGVNTGQNELLKWEELSKSSALGVPMPKLDVSARDRPLLKHRWESKISAAEQESTSHVVLESQLHHHLLSVALLSGFVTGI